MLFLLFQLGADRYALEAGSIAEVLPLVGIKRIPGSPKGVAGVFNYAGSSVPAIDLGELALGRPSQALLSTRIVVAHYSFEGGRRHLGLIAERATETLRKDPSEFAPPGVSHEGAPYLGPVTVDKGRLVQRIDVDTLLPAAIRDLIFREEVPSK